MTTNTMTVTPLDAPRPLPSVPCLTWEGRRVTWEPWRPAVRLMGCRFDTSCQCGHPVPAAAVGTIRPHDGETRRGVALIGPPSKRTGRPLRVTRDVPAWPLRSLHATLCPACFDLEVIVTSTPKVAPLTLLCDGCDALCAVAPDEDEARTTLTALGGWSSGTADWDLCPSCNPANPSATPSPRALDALRRARLVAPGTTRSVNHYPREAPHA